MDILIRSHDICCSSPRFRIIVLPDFSLKFICSNGKIIVKHLFGVPPKTDACTGMT